MKPKLITATQVREALKPLNHSQVQRLSKLSEVPFATLWHIREEHSKNPGVDTVGKFWPHIPKVIAQPTAKS